MINVLDEERQALTPDIQTILDEEEAKNPEKSYIYCAGCSHVVGNGKDAISVQNSHTHRFTNPYGYSFTIGCYSDALGCSISGRPSAADSWFLGYRWQLATCAACDRHLGWYFDTQDHYFYGLIINRIVID